MDSFYRASQNSARKVSSFLFNIFHHQHSGQKLIESYFYSGWSVWKWSVSQKNTLQNKGRSLVSGRRTECNWRLWQVEHILRMLKITLVCTAGFYEDFREVQPREEWEGALLLVLKLPSFFHYFRALKKPPVTYSILNRVLLVFVTLTKFVLPLTTN